jgi:hypothetical protein
MAYLVRSLQLNSSVPLTTGTFNLLSKTDPPLGRPQLFRLSGAVQSNSACSASCNRPSSKTFQIYRESLRPVNRKSRSPVTKLVRERRQTRGHRRHACARPAEAAGPQPLRRAPARISCELHPKEIFELLKIVWRFLRFTLNPSRILVPESGPRGRGQFLSAFNIDAGPA